MIHPRHDDEIVDKFLNGVRIKANAIKVDQKKMHEHLFMRDANIHAISDIISKFDTAEKLLTAAIAQTKNVLGMDDEEGQ